MLAFFVEAQQQPNMKATPEMPAPSPEMKPSRLLKMMAEGFDDKDDNYNIFSALMKMSGFHNEMSETEGKNLTIFAPTDSAFIRFARGQGANATNEMSIFNWIMQVIYQEGAEIDGKLIKGRNLLRAYLAYHMVGGLIGKDALEMATVVVTALGVPVTFAGNGEIIDLSPDTPNSMVVKPGLPDDGTITHSIDYILLPLPMEAEKLPICKK